MLIETVSELKEALEYVSTLEEIVCDVETDGLHPYRGNRICGIAFGNRHTPFYAPYRHGEGTNLPMETIRYFDPVLSHPEKTYVGFNYKFDLQFLGVDGIPLPTKIEEVLAAAHLMNENERVPLTKTQKAEYKAANKMQPSFKLKYLGKKYLYAEAAEEQDELVRKIIERGFARNAEDAAGQMWRLPASDVAPYACQDIILTHDLRDFYIEPLKIWHLYDMYQELNEYHLITTKMEMRGIVLDVPLIHKYMAEAEEMKAPAQAKLNELAGYEINANSYKQVNACLQLPSGKKEVLEDIMESEGDRFTQYQKEFAQALTDYRGWKTVNGTYYSRFLEEIGNDGFIHPNLSLIGTISGRLSCFSPNLQGIPKYSSVYKVKDVFLARPGYTLVSVDYQQAETRLAAHYMEIIMGDMIIKIKAELQTCTDPKRIKRLATQLKQIDIPYEETLSFILMSGISMHTETQMAIFGTSDKSLADYDYAKRTNFSVIYGIGASTLSDRLGLPIDQCAAILRKYHARFPGFRILYNTLQKSAEELGYIRMWSGRIRHYGPGIEPHKASSNLIQGGVAEIMRYAILYLARHYNNQDVHMLLQIHDQIIFEIPDSRVLQEIPVIVKIMTDFPQFRVPPKVDTKYGKSWGQMIEWKEAA